MLRGLWIDGNPTKREFTDQGDDTVFASSSMVPNADNKTINQSHSNLIASNEGISQILNMLDPALAQAQQRLMQLKPEELNSALLIITPSDIEVINPTGEIQFGKNGHSIVTNPLKGKYKLTLGVKTNNTRLIIAQFLPDGREYWKEYILKSKGIHEYILQFDPEDAQEDLIR